MRFEFANRNTLALQYVSQSKAEALMGPFPGILSILSFLKGNT